MGQTFIYFYGRDDKGVLTFQDLQRDLVGVIKKYNGRIVLLEDSTRKDKKSVNGLYEIPREGGIQIKLSAKRDIVSSSGVSVDGLVSCAGFNETSMLYDSLNQDLVALCQEYNHNRK